MIWQESKENIFNEEEDTLKTRKAAIYNEKMMSLLRHCNGMCFYWDLKKSQLDQKVDALNSPEFSVSRKINARLRKRMRRMCVCATGSSQ